MLDGLFTTPVYSRRRSRFVKNHTIENSPMDLSRHRRILLNVSRVAKLCEVWIIVEGSRLRKINFPRTRNYLHRFSKYIKLLFARQCIWFISLVILVNEGDSSHPAPTRVLAHSSCVRGTRTQPLVCVGCSVHYWVFFWDCIFVVVDTHLPRFEALAYVLPHFDALTHVVILVSSAFIFPRSAEVWYSVFVKRSSLKKFAESS